MRKSRHNLQRYFLPFATGPVDFAKFRTCLLGRLQREVLILIALDKQDSGAWLAFVDVVRVRTYVETLRGAFGSGVPDKSASALSPRSRHFAERFAAR